MSKKLVQINTVCNTSTGRIMGDIQREANRQGYDTISFVGRRKSFSDIKCEKIGNPLSFWIHVAITTVFDRQGYGSYFMTKKLVKRIKEEKPDIIHLHNLHGYYLNLPLLFDYLNNEYKGRVFWTFHDCWPITGHCPHFVAAKCYKWKTGCSKCPNKKQYPISLFVDASKRNYIDKKNMFTSLKNLTILTPSEWMADWIRDSYMGKYPIKVVNNWIDLEQFQYKPNTSVMKKYNIPENKKILLGVANVWDKRKGLQDFISLSCNLPSEYVIVLVGLSKIQIKSMPSNIIGLRHTDNRDELVALYSLSEIFINPSLEESFSLVTVESIACGTPVIVLDTSAVKELVYDDNGQVLHGHTSEDYLKAIKVIENKKLKRDEVAKTAVKYDKDKLVARIVEIYM
jgi:glycosyltransferase involved in cell wall biosynthesis